MFSPCSAKRRASDKDLPVLKVILKKGFLYVKSRTRQQFAPVVRIKLKLYTPVESVMELYAENAMWHTQDIRFIDITM